MRHRLAVFVVVLAALVFTQTAAAQQAPYRVQVLRVTVLSTMLADEGIGEWGFAALVEVDGKRILFDTGARPGTVLENAREMKMDLSNVTDVILSHNHSDHTSGLLTLRRELGQRNTKALSRTHVGRGIFWPRPGSGRYDGGALKLKAEYEASGGVFAEYDKPVEIAPGVWLTGPVPRVHPERNWSGSGRVQIPGGSTVEDNIPEDMSLVIDTEQGLVVISGCGHAGIINTLEFARQKIRNAPIHALLGGFHLFPASDASLDWTAGKLKEFGAAHLLGAHCTGIEAVYRIRQRAGLDRKRCVVGAVGATFTLGAGIDPRDLAR